MDCINISYTFHTKKILLERCDFIRIPTHIGIIPDGNRRWAQKNGKNKEEGYHWGLTPGLALLRLAKKQGVKEITYYGFTTDNCKRPSQQVAAFSKACVDAVTLIAKENVSLLVVGNTKSPLFPTALLPYTKRENCDESMLKVNFLVNYGWEWDLSDFTGGGNNNRKAISSSLKSASISKVDLILRWGGMRRLSGFLPIQSVYADFYVIDSLWPDFSNKDFSDALTWYQKQDVTLGG